MIILSVFVTHDGLQQSESIPLYIWMASIDSVFNRMYVVENTVIIITSNTSSAKYIVIAIVIETIITTAAI